MDTADFQAGRKVMPPALILWGEKSHTSQYQNPLTEWPQYCANIVRMKALPCGHYPTEQAPNETFEELLAFFR